MHRTKRGVIVELDCKCFPMDARMQGCKEDCSNCGSVRDQKNTDTTFGIHKRQDAQLGMGSKVVQLDGNKKILTVDDTEYKLTSGLQVLITNKHPQPDQWKPNDYQVYKLLVAQSRVRAFLNRTDGARPPRYMEHSQEPQLKKAFVDTGGIDINALIDGSGIVLD